MAKIFLYASPRIRPIDSYRSIYMCLRDIILTDNGLKKPVKQCTITYSGAQKKATMNDINIKTRSQIINCTGLHAMINESTRVYRS